MAHETPRLYLEHIQEGRIATQELRPLAVAVNTLLVEVLQD